MTCFKGITPFLKPARERGILDYCGTGNCTAMMLFLWQRNRKPILKSLHSPLPCICFQEDCESEVTYPYSLFEIQICVREKNSKQLKKNSFAYTSVCGIPYHTTAYREHMLNKILC